MCDLAAADHGGRHAGCQEAGRAMGSAVVLGRSTDCSASLSS
jgi:hypothetical protein